MQRVLTQKAINDLFFKAEMENLQKESLKNNVLAEATPTVATSFPSVPTVISSSQVKSGSVESAGEYFSDPSKCDVVFNIE